LADHIACDNSFNTTIPGAPKSKGYIRELSEKYRYFSIAKDIANSFKHRKITGDHRQIDGIDSLKERWTLIRFKDEAGYYYAARKVVIVCLKDGINILAEDVIERCIAAWIEELLRLGVIDSPTRITHLPKRLLLRSEVPTKPSIEMRAEQGEYFESRPILLTYDKERDIFLPMQGTIGSVEVDVKFIVAPSRFTANKPTGGQQAKDTSVGGSVP